MTTMYTIIYLWLGERHHGSQYPDKTTALVGLATWRRHWQCCWLERL